MKCPHCIKEVSCQLTGVQLIADDDRSLRGFFAAFCSSCHKPVSGAFECLDEQSRSRWVRYFQSQQHVFYHFMPPDMIAANFSARTIFPKIWPEYQKANAFEFLPADVQSAMSDAEEARVLGTPPKLVRAAYRTVIDVAIKFILARDHDKFCGQKPKRADLFHRIEFLAEQRILTDTLMEWAQGIRFITNEDVHTATPVTADEANEVAEFTNMLLQYLFELPGRMSRAKEEATAKRAK